MLTVHAVTVIAPPAAQLTVPPPLYPFLHVSNAPETPPVQAEFGKDVAHEFGVQGVTVITPFAAQFTVPPPLYPTLHVRVAPVTPPVHCEFG